MKYHYHKNRFKVEYDANKCQKSIKNYFLVTNSKILNV